MRIRLSKSLVIHLFPGVTADRETVLQSRRFNFWLGVNATLLGAIVCPFTFIQGDASKEFAAVCFTTFFAACSLISGVRIHRSGAGFVRNP